MQILCGALGGMGGCAMVRQSLINVNAGGTTRVSSTSTGIFIFLYILVGSELISEIPIAALTGVMLMLVLEIFNFTSFARLNKVPKTGAAVLVLVTGITYATNLAIAVAAGTVLASLSFAWQSAVRGVSAMPAWDDGQLVLRQRGPLFFGSIQSFKDTMRGQMPLVMPDDQHPQHDKQMVLDFMECRVWDSSALDAINTEAARLKGEGWGVRLRHLSTDCQHLLAKAGDTVDLEVMDDDPRYGLLASYDDIVRNKGSVKKIGSVLREGGSRWRDSSDSYDRMGLRQGHDTCSPWASGVEAQ
jgi:sulfate permease, SulP family